jgi:hypothetical protein
MILTPAPLQRPALSGAAVLPLRANVAPAQRSAAPMVRPVLQTLRATRQLCLDLQPRWR